MKIKEIFMYVLGAFVVGCAVTIITMLFFYSVPQSNHDAIMLAIGAALGWAGSVVSYFYGSSKGSSDKTDLLKEQNKS